MISDTPRNNFHNVILRYKVINFESNNMESYLNNILKWVKTRVFTGWKKNLKSSNFRLIQSFYSIIQ